MTKTGSNQYRQHGQDRQPDLTVQPAAPLITQISAPVSLSMSSRVDNWLLIHMPPGAKMNVAAMKVTLNQLITDDPADTAERFNKYTYIGGVELDEFCAELDWVAEVLADPDGDGYLYRRMDTTRSTMWQFFTTVLHFDEVATASGATHIDCG